MMKTAEEALEWADKLKEWQELYGTKAILDHDRHIDTLAAEVRRLREENADLARSQVADLVQCQSATLALCEEQRQENIALRERLKAADNLACTVAFAVDKGMYNHLKTALADYSKGKV